MNQWSRLTADFAQRMIEDLATNNTLRGAWAEQLVAHFLDIPNLSKSWSYYDMCDGAGRDISVKHSVGPQAKFSVEMKKWAWDDSLLDQSPTTEGWWVTDTIDYQHWCHTYVFAWLPADTAAPCIDDVLDSDQWRFAVLSREQMYRKFVDNLPAPQKSVSLAGLGTERFRPGTELPDLVAGTPIADDGRLVPPRSKIPWIPPGPAAPIEPATSDVVPESVVGSSE
jgi:hypothetical protein